MGVPDQAVPARMQAGRSEVAQPSGCAALEKGLLSWCAHLDSERESRLTVSTQRDAPKSLMLSRAANCCQLRNISGCIPPYYTLADRATEGLFGATLGHRCAKSHTDSRAIQPYVTKRLCGPLANSRFNPHPGRSGMGPKPTGGSCSIQQARQSRVAVEVRTEGRRGCLAVGGSADLPTREPLDRFQPKFEMDCHRQAGTAASALATAKRFVQEKSSWNPAPN